LLKKTIYLAVGFGISGEVILEQKLDAGRKPKVGFFVTCLVNAIRPSVGFAAIELLEMAGCTVEIPPCQTCCGLPGFNSGDLEQSRRLGKTVINAFERFDYVVIPSGSCAGMIARHYPEHLFKGDGPWTERAESLGRKTFELTSFLVDVLEFAPARLIHDMGHLRVTYHDSCSSLRQMKVRDQPRKLLKELCNIEVQEMEQTEECCGFGGTFSLKMPKLSSRLADNKIDNALATGAETLLGGDMGCLLHLEGRMKHRGISMEVRHVAEVLAGGSKDSRSGEGHL
jgi:L-lactate dehydrogenase complex protein LldE